MKKIAIIGRGNVGTHIFKALRDKPVEVNLIEAKTLDYLSYSYDIILITVKDTFIVSLAKKIACLIPEYRGIVAHTAGSVEMDVLSPYFNNFGVVYPMQTFNRDIEMDHYDDIPFFIEGNSNNVTSQLKEFAALISHKIFELSSSGRMSLHIASVFSCNFVNALYTAAEEILKDSNLEFDLLLPLIKQTTQKVMTSSPIRCQTGPARRGDTEVVKKQFDYLKENPSHQNIYGLISSYIYNKYHNE